MRHAPDIGSMVEGQLRARGIRDRRVLDAMRSVPRDRFLPAHLRAAAFQDSPIPIGFGQTISQPFMVALMLEALELRGTERVLDVGTGSGYQAALLGRLARDVISIEVIPELAEKARRTIASLGISNVNVVFGDGSLGWLGGAPYDAIVVAAASPEVPAPLVAQLADGGRLVIPVGNLSGQVLYRVRKSGPTIETEALERCTFVPLVGEHGWPILPEQSP